MIATAWYAYANLEHYEAFDSVEAAQQRRDALLAERPGFPFQVGQFYTFEKGDRVVCRRRGTPRFGDTGTIADLTENGLYVVHWTYGRDEAMPPNFLEPLRGLES